MQLRHLKAIQPPSDGIARVTAVAWSPNNARLAVVTAAPAAAGGGGTAAPVPVVQLFDENGERRDKFATKPQDKVR